MAINGNMQGFSDIDLSIDPEGLIEKGKIIGKESEVIKQALVDIDEARKLLDGWVSQNRERYDAKLAAAIPKMEEMTEVIDSYSGVAIQASERAVNVENKIARAIDGGNII